MNVPPQTGNVEKREKPLNWHLTEVNGRYSVGTTEDATGFHPADEEKGMAMSWVAPSEYVDNYPDVKQFGHNDEAVRAAIRAWAKENGL